MSPRLKRLLDAQDVPDLQPDDRHVLFAAAYFAADDGVMLCGIDEIAAGLSWPLGRVTAAYQRPLVAGHLSIAGAGPGGIRVHPQLPKAGGAS